MKKQIISASFLVIGFLAGATALSTLATGTWTAPTATPPDGNTDAPINVSTAAQVKTGLLGLSDSMIKNLQVLTGEGTSTTNTTIGTGGVAGKVLMAIDKDGTVGWRSVATGGASFNRPTKTKTYSNNQNYPPTCGNGAPADAWGLAYPGWDGKTYNYVGTFTWGVDGDTFGNGVLGVSTGADVWPGDSVAKYYVKSGDPYLCSYNITSGRWLNQSKCAGPDSNKQSVIHKDC